MKALDHFGLIEIIQCLHWRCSTYCKHLPDISKGMIPDVLGKVVKCWLQSYLGQSVSIRASFNA